MQTSSNMSDQTYAKDDRYFHSLNAILQSTVRTLKETLNKLLFNMNMYTSSNMFDQAQRITKSEIVWNKIFTFGILKTLRRKLNKNN